MGTKRKISLEEPVADVRWLDGVTVTPYDVHDTTRQEWREANAREKEQDEINKFTGNIRNATNNAAKNITTALEYTPVVGDIMSVGHGINHLVNGRTVEGLAPFVMPKAFSLLGKNAYKLYRGIRYGSMPERRFWETAMRTHPVDPTGIMLNNVKNAWKNKTLEGIPLRYILTGKGKNYWGYESGYAGGINGRDIIKHEKINFSNNDPVSAYLYDRPLAPELFERISNATGGLDPNYKRFGNINRFYRTRKNYNVPNQEYLNNSTLRYRDARDNINFDISTPRYIADYNSGGIGITEMLGPDGKKYPVWHDVWGFTPKGGSNYLDKWIRNPKINPNASRITNFVNIIKEIGLKRLNKIGHPFYVEDLGYASEQLGLNKKSGLYDFNEFDPFDYEFPF